MKKCLFRYFFKNTLHSFLFWLVIFVVGIEFVIPFLIKINRMIELSRSGEALMIERMILEQLNLNLYIIGFLLAPTLGIIAGRALSSREVEVLLAQKLSRKDLYLGAFVFYGLFLLLIWLVFILFYLLVEVVFNQPITFELISRLVISFFGILLPFFWVGFFAINLRPVAVILIYLFIFLTAPSLSSFFAQPESSKSEKILAGAGKLLSIAVPQIQSFQLIASPFSPLEKTTTYLTLLKWFCYGVAWSGLLLLSGFLLYRKKDLANPTS